MRPLFISDVAQSVSDGTGEAVIPAKALHRMVYRAKAGIQSLRWLSTGVCPVPDTGLGRRLDAGSSLA